MITSAEEFYRLRTSEIKREYDRASYEQAPLEVWLEVIKKFPEMRSWIAHNKTVPIKVLEILSQDGNPKVRSIVATKRKLPEHIQLILAKDRDTFVRERLVWNDNAADSVLQILAEDIELHIREKAEAQLSKVA
jgi:hypothetical protein